MVRKPVIGITTYDIDEAEGAGGKFRGGPGQGFSMVSYDNVRAIEQAGGVCLGIPVQDPSSCSHIVRQLDALVFSGGEDIDPTLYGGRPDTRSWIIAPERDRFELALMQEALNARKPILAICRGLQLLNVHFGGTLYQDVTDDDKQYLAHQFIKGPRWYLSHQVKLLAPVLKQLFGTDELMVNSFHHQSVKEVGAGLVVAAVAEDGIIEGLIHPDYPNVLAVQWHPETIAVKYEEGLLLFRWLIEQIQ